MNFTLAQASHLVWSTVFPNSEDLRCIPTLPKGPLSRNKRKRTAWTAVGKLPVPRMDVGRYLEAPGNGRGRVQSPPSLCFPSVCTKTHTPAVSVRWTQVDGVAQNDPPEGPCSDTVPPRPWAHGRRGQRPGATRQLLSVGKDLIISFFPGAGSTSRSTASSEARRTRLCCLSFL